MRFPTFLCLLFVTAAPGVAAEKLIYHDIRTDAQGHIIPWSHDEPGAAYDHVLGLVWKFWDEMRTDINGLPYYLNHQVWRPGANDPRGVAGGQFEMAMSSWQLYYQYTGNERVRENLRFQADYVLTHGMSPPDCQWPNLPFPYNTLIYSGQYDGDMVIGAGFTQPDKAGAFGNELARLARSYNFDAYPHATHQRYWQAAIAIADTLAAHVQPGDADHSPLPFKVHAFTGEIGPLLNNDRSGKSLGGSGYTSNWAGTLELFEQLIDRNLGHPDRYRQAHATVLAWMKQYPMRNNKWGPFFEDVPGWSDTQINAMTWARYIMTHQPQFADWKGDVQHIIDWVYQTLPNRGWEKYGVVVVNEQTAYQVPGNSHSSRQAADELLFAALTGDTTRVENATRQLNWATYMVDDDGKNRYPSDEVWMSDGYGDYVRHFIRAMGARPQLAPANQTHLLASTSVIQSVGYQRTPGLTHVRVDAAIEIDRVLVAYVADESAGTEILRVAHKPTAVYLGKQQLTEDTAGAGNRYSWQSLGTDGILIVHRTNGNRVAVAE